MDRVVAILLEFWRFLTGENDRADGVMARVFEDNFDGLVVVGEDGRVIAASRVASALLVGSAGETLAGRSAASVLPPPMLEAVRQAFVDGRRAVASPMALARIGDPESGGHVVQFVVTLSELSSPAAPLPRRIVNVTFWDETERRRREEEQVYLGTHDPVTGALVRSEFVKQTGADLRDRNASAAGHAVLAVGLASHEALDAALGTPAGDAIVRQVFGRLKAAGLETIGRLDGQTFAAGRPGRLTEDRLARFCADLIDRLTLPYAIEDRWIIVGVSIGVAQAAVSGYDAESLLAHAGFALASAREQLPASTFVLFDEPMARRLRERRNLAPALASARQRGEMSVVYQPQCLLESGAMIGVEASIRWLHPDLGVVPPDQFLPLAEESGEIIELGRWALRTACRDVASWPFATRLAVPVSTAQFALVDIVDEVKDALAMASLSPHRLDLEVAEAPFLVKSDQMAGRLRELHAMGVGITLDNFGAGRASLAHLSRLSADRIKIAGGFVSQLPADGEAGAVIRAVMTLAFSLDKAVIADGIETADQAWMLRMMGCKLGQGPFYGRPRSSRELVEWHKNRATGRLAAV